MVTWCITPPASLGCAHEWCIEAKTALVEVRSTLWVWKSRCINTRNNSCGYKSFENCRVFLILATGESTAHEIKTKVRVVNTLKRRSHQTQTKFIWWFSTFLVSYSAVNVRTLSASSSIRLDMLPTCIVRIPSPEIATSCTINVIAPRIAWRTAKILSLDLLEKFRALQSFPSCVSLV